MARPVRKGDRWRLVHSDHFAMILNLQNLPTKRLDDRRKRNVTWNLARKDGWEKYKSLTKEKSDEIREVIEEEGLDMEEVMDKLEKIEGRE